MDKYYYFVSQLPSLQFNQKAQTDRASFLEEAKKWLTDPEFKVISRIDIDDFFETSGGPQVLSDYGSFEKALRNEIALVRKAKKENKSYQPKAEIAKAISGQPLEVEINLLELRWKFIEERALEHNFDLASLILYFLKLQIVERIFSFDKGKGTVRFDQLTGVKL
ncbi:MAG: DUF2764 domain-containing protein [Candidatus Omnitrophica bacterium]|nr:DUF2764 domain-containing protein [Candidatus Omnitrophota bacterium]